MKLLEETIRIQEAFGAYCRTGSEADMPGLTPGRIQHYRRLISNVVYDTLEKAFPIAMASLKDERRTSSNPAGMEASPGILSLPCRQGKRRKDEPAFPG
jgi:hypothetical protein